MKFMADSFAPLQRLEDFDISGKSTALLSQNNVRKSEVGTFLSFLQNLLVHSRRTNTNTNTNTNIGSPQNDIFVNKIAQDITKGLGVSTNLTSAEMLDMINEFAYDPINTPVYNPSQNGNFYYGTQCVGISISINY